MALANFPCPHYRRCWYAGRELINMSMHLCYARPACWSTRMLPRFTGSRQRLEDAVRMPCPCKAGMKTRRAWEQHGQFGIVRFPVARLARVSGRSSVSRASTDWLAKNILFSEPAPMRSSLECLALRAVMLITHDSRRLTGSVSSCNNADDGRADLVANDDMSHQAEHSERR